MPRIVLLSDTHNTHEEINVPDGENEMFADKFNRKVGTKFVNASIVNQGYQPTNAPIIIDL